METNYKSITDTVFPPLPISLWEKTKDTLHLYIQIIGKIKLALMPKKNHWWHIPLYVTSTGLSTSPIPYHNRTFEIKFDFIDHEVSIELSDGDIHSFSLHNGLSVADFYEQLFGALRTSGIYVEISAKPFKNVSNIPFPIDSIHNTYNNEYVSRFWKILVQTDMVFKEFSGRFYGKTCPVQLYWHSFDLTLTRFSGRTAPELPEADKVNKEAYSHEVISFGFWPGDKEFREPAFYSYTYPAPEGLVNQKLYPKEAVWLERNGSPLAIYKYQDMIKEDNPKEALLSFLESTYLAGASLGNWPIEELKNNFI